MGVHTGIENGDPLPEARVAVQNGEIPAYLRDAHIEDGFQKLVFVYLGHVR